MKTAARPTTLLLAALLACAAVPRSAAAQHKEPDPAVARIARESRARLDGLRSLTLEQTALGTRLTTHLERGGDPSRPLPWTLYLSGDAMDAFGAMFAVMGQMLPLTVLALDHDSAADLRLAGTETVDGRPAFVVEGSTGRASSPDLAAGGVIATMRLLVDSADLRVRRMEVRTGGDGAGSFTADFLDWREVEGVALPWRRRLVMHGFGAMGEDLEVTVEAMREARGEIEKLPPEQRAEAETVMAAFDEMSRTGTLTVEVAVTAARVNAPRPEGMLNVTEVSEEEAPDGGG
ncbi:MAG TPA: hypothetical protein VHG91_02785 [Longimicrobium sp.]|nr:hypothetical protein [Longimicrobium sp.]